MLAEQKSGRWLLVATCALAFGCGGGGGSSSGGTVTAPSITTQPTSKSVVAGNSVSFYVGASGSNLSYQWYKLSSGTGVAIDGATSASYSIASAQTSNAGSYYAAVSNSAGTATSNTVTLTVSSTSGGANVEVN